MKKIIAIDTSDIGAAYTAEAIISLGYEPLFITCLDDYYGDTRHQLSLQPILQLSDTSNVDTLIAGIQHENIQDIAGVISFSDAKVRIAAQLAERLGVPGNDIATVNLADKSKVQQLIPEFSPHTINFTADHIPYQQLTQFLTVHHKLMIKPTQSAGAQGIFTVNNQHELEQIESSIAAQAETYSSWIAQAFLIGDLISLEGFVSDGQIHFIDFARREKFKDTETINYFPSNKKIPSTIDQQAKTAVTTLIQRSQFKNGYFHVEFIMSADYCYLIDANVGRIGGGGTAQQLGLAYGIAPQDIFRHVIDITLFNGKNSPIHFYHTTPQATVSVNYGLPFEAIFEATHLPQSKNFLHTQLIDPGLIIPALGPNNFSWLGIAVGHPDQLFQEIQQINIVTSQGNVPPCYTE